MTQPGSSSRGRQGGLTFGVPAASCVGLRRGAPRNRRKSAPARGGARLSYIVDNSGATLEMAPTVVRIKPRVSFPGAFCVSGHYLFAPGACHTCLMGPPRSFSGKGGGMAVSNRRRPAVSVTLPADVVDSLRAKAAREFRPLSREIEIAAIRHLAEAKTGASQ